MSKRIDVLLALDDCLRAALPGASVVGAIDGRETIPARLAPAGRVVVQSGDPGEPEVDLSPRHYWYNHRIPISVAVVPIAGRTDEEVLAALLSEIEVAVLGDVRLAALCEYLEFTAPDTFDLSGGERGSSSARGADLDLIASYGSPTPLS